MTIAKMGALNITVFDQDGVEAHNMPNQFYRIEDEGQFKVDALYDIIQAFSGVEIENVNKHFTEGTKLEEIVIVATDSMHSRRLVWEEFRKQLQCTHLIEARMGAELGIVYTISKDDKWSISNEPIEFYESTLHSDEKGAQLLCTARAIIYNILMISALIGKSFASIVNNTVVPREMIFNMEHINQYSFMVRE